MAATTSVGCAKIDWLYPELLSREGLIEILSQRFVKLPDEVDSVPKDDLLELYYQHVIPRPQRKYRLNRRGRDMAKKQVLQNKKRKITGPDTSDSSQLQMKKPGSTEPSRLLTSFDGLPSGDRLKPPPSCISADRKVIQLGGTKASGSSRPTDGDAVSSPTAPKVVKLNRTSSASSDPATPTSPSGAPVNKTVKLINSHLGSPTSNHTTQNATRQAQPMEVDSPEANTTKKVQIKKISWP